MILKGLGRLEIHERLRPIELGTPKNCRHQAFKERIPERGSRLKNRELGSYDEGIG